MMWRHRSGRLCVMSAAEQGNVAMSPCRHVAATVFCCGAVSVGFGYGAVIANIRKLNFSSGFGPEMKIPMTSLSWGV
jgi:hypothetical protein